MGDIIGSIILGVVAIGFLIFSGLQFNEKGFLFNNTYIYASKQERETMNKKPHYRQSAVIFLFLGIIFLINAVDMILKTGWLFYCVIALIIVLLLFAIISSVMIEKKNK